MELMNEWVSYDSPAGSVAAYLARPTAAGDPLPSVVVIQEIWGVDGHIQDVADRVAGAGYVALAPDLYSAGGGRPPALAVERVEAAKAFLNTIPPAEWMTVLGDDQRRAQALGKLPDGEGERVGETLGTLFGGARDPERHLGVLQGAVAYLDSHPACAGRAIGSVGFCLGGGLSALLACEEPRLGGGCRLLRSVAERRAGRLDRLSAARLLRARRSPHSRRPARLRGRAARGRRRSRAAHLPGHRPRLLQRHPAELPPRGRPRRVGSHARVLRREARSRADRGCGGRCWLNCMSYVKLSVSSARAACSCAGHFAGDPSESTRRAL